MHVAKVNMLQITIKFLSIILPHFPGMHVAKIASNDACMPGQQANCMLRLFTSAINEICKDYCSTDNQIEP